MVPGSHKIFTDIFKNRPELTACGDFIRLNKFGPVGMPLDHTAAATSHRLLFPGLSLAE